MVSESWSTHCTGSVCIVRSSSTAMPQKKITTLAMASGYRCRRWEAAEEHDQPPEWALAEVLAGCGERCSRIPRIASGITIETRQIAAMPTASKQAEIADHRHLGEPQREEREDRVERDDEQRGTRGCATVSWIGCSLRSRTASSSTRACIWIA